MRWSKAAIGALADHQSRKQTLRLAFRIALGLAAAHGATLGDVREPVRGQRRLGQRACKQASGVGELFRWRDEMSLGDVDRRTQINVARRSRRSSIMALRLMPRGPSRISAVARVGNASLPAMNPRRVFPSEIQRLRVLSGMWTWRKARPAVSSHG